MSKRQLIVKVNSLDKSLADFNKAWKKIEEGEKRKIPLEIVSFESATLLMKTLTPKRLELLQQLHTLGKTSIRTLAQALSRDYSNVHQDIKALFHIGLVLQDKTGKYFMPWDKIITEIPMTVVRTSYVKEHKHSKKIYPRQNTAHG